MDSLLLPCHAVLYPLSRTVSDWVTQWGDLKEHQWSPCRSNEKSPPVGLWPVTKIGGDLFFFFFYRKISWEQCSVSISDSTSWSLDKVNVCSFVALYCGVSSQYKCIHLNSLIKNLETFMHKLYLCIVRDI